MYICVSVETQVYRFLVLEVEIKYFELLVDTGVSSQMLFKPLKFSKLRIEPSLCPIIFKCTSCILSVHKWHHHCSLYFPLYMESHQVLKMLISKYPSWLDFHLIVFQGIQFCGMVIGATLKKRERERNGRKRRNKKAFWGNYIWKISH